MSPAAPSPDYDVVIVGGGFAGALLTKELAGRGLHVLVLEAGFATTRTWDDHSADVDRFLGQLAKVPNSAYAPNANAPSATVLDIRQIEPGVPDTDGYLVQLGPLPVSSDYLRAGAGTSNHWLGLSFRLLPNDYRTATVYGVGVDWPDDLDMVAMDPYYQRAEREIGVAGEVADQTFHGLEFPPGYVYPMHAVPQSHQDRWMAQRLDGFEVHLDGATTEIAVVSLPQARNSTPNPAYLVDGRPYRPVGAPGNPGVGERCEGNSACIPICPVQAKWDASKTFASADADRVRVLTQAVVSRVEHNAGRITGLRYQRYDDSGPVGDPVVVSARRYVLAGHSIANAVLLLASGLEDPHGHVGRNLMDHPYLLTWGLAPEDVGPYRGPDVTSGVPAMRDGPFRAHRAAWRTDISNWGWSFSAFSPGSDVETAVASGRYGADLRRHLADEVPRQVRFGFLLEQLPDPGNRVSIDRRWTDPLGHPRPVIAYDVDRYTRAGFAAATEFTRQVFDRLGVEDRTRYSDTDPGHLTHDGRGYTFHGAGHIVGTHRMGNDPAEGFVDSTQRCWHHPELFVVGCGSMPTVATGNPSLTMAALTYRTADAIVADLGGAGP